MESSGNVCTFIRKRKKQAVRIKGESSGSDEDAKIFRKKTRVDSNPLVQSTTNFAAKRNYGSNSDSSDSETKSSVAFKANYLPTQSGPADQGATATLEIDTDDTRDAQAIFIRAQKINKDVQSNQDKLYRGVNNYAQYIEKKDTVMGNAASGFNRRGPIRAPAHLRATVRWDYQPDICKDYKETGFCTFGDSCKFLHDRSDYKHGWQIDREIAEGTYGVEGVDDRYEINDLGDEDADEHLPLKCLICQGEFKDPVVTSCKHYFCSVCALKRFKKTARCYACTEDTKGTFKMAKDLLSRIAVIKAKRKASSDVDSDENAEHSHGVDPCCHHDVDHLPSTSKNEHYISSSELEDSSDDDARNQKSKPLFPTLHRLEGAQPEAPEFCDTDEESD